MMAAISNVEFLCLSYPILRVVIPEHEIIRQKAIIESSTDPDNAKVPQETRGFDEHRFETYKLRSKEDATDYRYMPDPNLGTLVLSEVCFILSPAGNFLLTL
jgi:hypothetical protein